MTQHGNEIKGEAAFAGGCHLGESGHITGKISGSSISFELILKNETVMNYIGTISNDFCTLGGSYRYVPNDEEGTWLLSCQN